MASQCKLTRRGLLANSGFIVAAGTAAAAFGPPAAAAPVGSLRLRPGGAPVEVSTRILDGSCRIVFDSDSDSESVQLPNAVVTFMGRAPLAGRDLLVAGFAASSAVDLLAFIGWDGARIRILAVEPLEVRAPGRLQLAMHLAGTPDTQLLQLFFELAGARSPTLPFHRSWIDLLGFRDLAPLTDMATRAPMPGSCQARLAEIRARVGATLDKAGDGVTAADIAAAGLIDLPAILVDAMAEGGAAHRNMADP